MTVNHEEDFVDAIQLGHQLRGLERCQCFSCAGSMPDIAVLVGVLNTVENLFYSIILIWTKYHQALVALVHHNVLADYLPKNTLVKEVISKLTEVVNRLVVRQRPVECKFVTAVGIVGEIACVDAIGNDEKLDIIEQSTERGLLVSLYLIVCLFEFNATLF